MTAAHSIERDLAAPREVFTAAVVCREREADGSDAYTAWEPATMASHAVTCDIGGQRFGRIDTRRATRNPSRSWLEEQSALINWEMAQQARARQVIRAACPEAVAGANTTTGVTVQLPGRGTR